MKEQIIDALPYIAIVLAILTFVLYKYMKHRESEFKKRKQARQKKKICEDMIILSDYTEQRLQLNLMALDAARQMFSVAKEHEKSL